MGAAFRVALDARRLAGKRRGIGLYVHNLVQRLPACAPDVEFLLLVDCEIPSSRIPRGCRQVVLGGRNTPHSQSTSNWRSKLYSVFWMNALVPRVLRRERVDLFHAANVTVPLSAPCASVVTIHDLVTFRVPGTHGRFYEFYRRRLIPDAARRADRIIAVSESTKKDIVGIIGVAPEKITVIHHGVDESFAPVADSAALSRVRKQYRLPPRFVLHVGAVERQKRLEPLMCAASRLLMAGLADGIVLAGEEGRGSDDVKQAAAQLGISEQVHFLGYVAQEVLPALYSLARCTVYPSWYEGFGMPVLEAMACGSPVITSNTSSLPEVAGDAGLLVPPGDAEALAGALEQILANERFRDELIHRGLARARRFRWDTCAAMHASVYREILEAKAEVA